MLRLRTFGGLWLTNQAGDTIEHPRPRRLALLAVLAAASPRGVSRERLLGILWPEGAEERGRHALAQTVYSLRADLGADAAITGSTELKLDSELIGSDVGDFTAALARGDREAAARLFTGPFLDGFYLSDGAEFERWMEEERARLAGLAVGAIEQLAMAPGGVEWRKRLTELNPLRGRYAVEYMNALAAAGDRGAALEHGRAHEARVRRELGESPEPEVTRLAHRIRGAPSDPEPAIPAATPIDFVAPVPAPAGPAPVLQTRNRMRARIGALLILALPLAGFVLWRVNKSPEPFAPPLLAVGSVRDAATRDSVASGAVLTDMLATSLARIRGLQVVANSRLLELTPRGTDTLPGSLSQAARRAGAQEMFEGELTYAADGGLRLQLRRIDLVTGVVRQGYSVQAFDRYAAVDSVTSAIAASFGLAAPSKPIAEVSTSSPIAYRLYEEGLRAYQQYDVPASARLMDAALEEDSTFAMAAYYAWLARMRDFPTERPARELALRLAPRAPDRERLLILGQIRMWQEDPTALAPAESLAIRFPADPEGQRLFGQIQYLRGDYPSAAPAFRRAIALDSSASADPNAVCHACQDLHGLFGIYLAWDSVPAAERSVHSWLRLRPQERVALTLLAELRTRQERWEEAEALLRQIDSVTQRRNDFDEVRFRAAIRRGRYDEVAKTAAPALTDADPSHRMDARWLWLIALRNQGRLREAMSLAAEGRIPGGGRVSPESLEPDDINRAIIAFESGDYATAVHGFRTLATIAGTIEQPGHRSRGVSWNLTHLGAAYAAAGDTAAVRRLADSVQAIGPRSLYGRSARLYHFLRGLLQAAAGHQSEAVEAYHRANLSWTEGYTRINLEMARSLLASNHPKDAILPLQQALRGGIDGSNLYVTRTELHELLAQSFVAANQPDSAAAHYAAVVQAWEQADSPFQPRRRAAQEWIARHPHRQ